jgi:hypothetical protein
MLRVHFAGLISDFHYAADPKRAGAARL